MSKQVLSNVRPKGIRSLSAFPTPASMHDSSQQQTATNPSQSSPISPNQQGKKHSTSRGSQGLEIFLALACLGWVGWKVAYGQYYTSRSPFGFYLGVAGSLLMISAVLGYPLRKRIGFMQRWGAIKHWFRIHMFLGLAGPTLILFHATFHARSPNAGVALISMLLVVASGVIGRFIYSKIHFGLYGRRANLKTLQEKLKGSSEQTQTCLQVSSKIATMIHGFEHSALKTNRPFPENFLHMLGLGFWRKWLELRCRWELHRVLKNQEQPLLSDQASVATRLISSYLKGVQRVAQFKIYERIFSLWHVLHIPLIYILAATGVFHVIAVYMY